jgi:hypothetical protein
MKKYQILLLLSMLQFGCTYPKISVETSNPVIKAYGYEINPECKIKNCRYTKTSEILLNIDTQQNQVAYHVEKKLMGDLELKQLYDGKLTNCNVISKHDFNCDELRSKDDLLSVPIRIDYQTKKQKVIKEPFSNYAYVSDSYLAQGFSYVDVLNSSTSKAIENYSFIIYLIIGLVIFAAIITS